MGKVGGQNPLNYHQQAQLRENRFEVVFRQPGGKMEKSS